MTPLMSEIRELKAELAELRVQRDLLQDAVENVRHALCVFDADGRIAYCNGRYSEAIGLPADEVKPGLSGRELVAMAKQRGYYPEDVSVDDAEELFWKNLRSEGEATGQLKRKGRTFNILPGRTAAGNFVATFEDVTAQASAEAALRQSEARFRAMLDAMPDCVSIFDAQDNLTYINPAGLKMLEAPDLEALTSSGHRMVAAEYDAAIHDVQNRVRAGETVTWRYCIKGMRGGRRDVEAHAVPFSQPHGALGHLRIERDITLRKQAEDALHRSEERLQLVHKATGLADFEAFADGTLHCSARFFDQVGLAVPADGLISYADFRAVIHPDDRDWLGEETRKAIDGLTEFSCEFRICRMDTGETRWIAGHTVIERDAEGNLHRTIGAQLDITDRKLAEMALRKSEERLRLIQDASGLADFENDGGDVSWCSDMFFDQVGMPVGDNTIKIWDLLDLVHPDDRERLNTELEQARVDADVFDSEYRIVRRDNGETRWISCRTKLLRDAQGNVARTLGAHRDITHRKQGELALQESEERFRLAAEAAGFGVWDYDAGTNKRQWSNRLIEIFGMASGTVPSIAAATACILPADRQRFIDLFERAYREKGERFEEQFRLLRVCDRSERWIAVHGWKAWGDKGRLDRIIWTFRDITDEKTAEERIRWNARHDALTRLANRSCFQEKLEEAIARAGDDGGKSGGVGLLLLDLDHFKQINDTLGHDAGDHLLKMFSERLSDVVRPGDVVGRLGGDEFAIMLSDVPETRRIAELAASIHERLRDPFVYKGRILDCRASIGGALFPQDGQTHGDLMMNADMALYSAKNSGRSRTKMYEPKLRDETETRANMILLAREAIDASRIEPFYQPKLDLRSREIIGFEALLRWRGPDGQIQLPEKLEAAFENVDVAAALSESMITQAVADMRGWLDSGVAFGHVAVNASAADFRREDFAESVLEKLATAGVPASMLQLEVTETVFLGRGSEYVHSALSLFNSEGVHIALDDFGTGYASLRHLKAFPVDVIKIDRSFVRDMETDPGDDAIVRAVIGLGRSLGIDVVAEGVEQERHVERLLNYGCHLGQGFLFARAQPAAMVPSLIAAAPRKLGRRRGDRLRLVTPQQVAR